MHIIWEQKLHMTKSLDTRYDLASADCSVEIDIVRSYFKDRTISYMGAVVIVIVWWLDLRPSVPITTNVVVRNPFLVRCTLYNIMWYNLSVTSNRFPLGTPVSSTNTTNLYDITDILLKVVLNTIPLALFLIWMNCMVSKSARNGVFSSLQFNLLTSRNLWSIY